MARTINELSGSISLNRRSDRQLIPINPMFLVTIDHKAISAWVGRPLLKLPPRLRDEIGKEKRRQIEGS